MPDGRTPPKKVKDKTMGKYNRLLEKLSMLGDVLNDEFAVQVEITGRHHRIAIISKNGKSVEFQDGEHLFPNGVFIAGPVDFDALPHTIVTALTGESHPRQYVYDAFGPKKHEFRL